MFLGPNNVNFFAIVESFANKRHILEREEGDLSPLDLLGTSQNVSALPIKGTLAEDGTQQDTILEMGLDIFKDLKLGLGGRANQNNMRTGDHLGGVLGRFVDLANEVASSFPS
jgi:hypothetical protein